MYKNNARIYHNLFNTSYIPQAKKVFVNRISLIIVLYDRKGGSQLCMIRCK